MAESVRAPGGSSFSAFGRTILSIGSGIADVLVVIVAGIFLATQPRFYLTGAVKLDPAGKRQLGARGDHGIGDRAAAVVARPADRDGRGRLADRERVCGRSVCRRRSTLGLLAGRTRVHSLRRARSCPLVPAILLALAVSPDLALWVLLLYFAVQQFEGYVLTPLVQQYAVDLPGVVLLFSLLASGALFGTLGVILAAPLTVVATFWSSGST